VTRGRGAGVRVTRGRGVGVPMVRGRPDRGLPRWLVWTAAGLGGLAAGLLIGGWPGVVAGLLAVLPVRRAVSRLEPPAVRRERQRAAADLPYLVDLVAAALRAGLPVERAVQVVAAAASGPAAERLGRVERGLALGLPPARAWSALGDLAGGARLAAAAGRSAQSGAALAAGFERVAEELRADRAAGVDAAASRLGVLIVLPLGLCFLPAFVLAGVLPVIVAVLSDALR
jgi:pilus assembly protein TadC